MGIMFNRTQHIKLEEEKSELKNQLYQSQKLESIGQLASGIAHDFNNVLTPILGFTQMCQGAIEENNLDEADYCLTRIEKSALRAADLVEKMLIFSREKETGENKQLVDPLEIANDVVEISKMLRAGISTTIDIDIENLLPINSGNNISILIDPTELNQVLTNLIVNAKDAITESWKNSVDNWLNDGGRITIKFSLQNYAKKPIFCNTCSSTLHEEYLVIDIIDSGSGIKPEKINKIFDPFFTTKEVGKGTGLGLSMVNTLIHNVSGHILVSSKLNEGTKFSLLFPVVFNEIERELSSEKIQNTQKFLTTRKEINIFIVDDEEDICEFYDKQLSKFGYRVFTFTNSIDAWQSLNENINKADIVITDYGMPNMTGLDLAKGLLALKPDLPIIICTGYSDKLKTAKDLPAGRTFLFNKPLDMNTINETILSIFES